MTDTILYEPDDEQDQETLAQIAEDPESPLVKMRKQMQAEKFKPAVLPVRDGWALKVRTDITLKEVDNLAKAAKRMAKQNPQLSESALEHQLTISAATLEILSDGQPVLTDDGDPATFDSEDIKLTLGVKSATAAVKKFLGKDAKVAAVAVAVMRVSGYGDGTVVEEEDPTGSGS